MTDMPTDLATGQRNWQSIRTVLEGLILASVLWLGSTTQDQTKATIQLQTQMGSMGDELRNLRSQFNDVPQIARGMAKVEVRLDEHERRIYELEQPRRTR